MNTNILLRNAILGGIFVIPFLVFVVSSNLFFPFITGKNFDFRIITEIIFGLWVILALRDINYRPKFSWLLVAVASFVGIIALADILGESPFKSIWSNFERMEGLVALLHFLMYFIVVGSVLKTQQLWNWFFNTSIGVSIIISIYGFMQLAGKLVIHQGGVRLDATFGNATYLAVYMLFHLFITAFMLLRWRGANWGRYFYGIALLFQLIILYHTATRGAILGFIGGAFLTALLIAVFEKERVVLRKSAMALVAAVVLLVGGFFAVKNTDFVQESPVLSRFASISLESDGNARFIIWGMALEGVKEHPILGWGQENFNYVFNKYYDSRLYAQEPWFDRVHNIILDWMIAGGILGLLAYLSIPIIFLFLLWRAPEARLSAIDKSIFTGLLAGYFFHNLFVFDNLISYIYYFTVLAYIYSLTGKMFREDSPLYREVDEKMLRQIVVPFVIVLTIIALYFFNAKGIKTARTLLSALSPQELGPTENLELFKKAFNYNSLGRQESAEQLTTTSLRIRDAELLSDEIKVAFLATAGENLEQFIAERPGDARLHVFAASFYRGAGLYTEALEHLEIARLLTPGKQNIYFELGSVYISQRDFENAFTELEYAYQLDPRFDRARTNYAVAASYVGKGEVVDEMVALTFADYDQGIREELVLDNRIMQAYITLNQYDKIVDMFQQAIERTPENIQFYLSLAATYNEVGQRTKAIQTIERAIEIEPSFKDQGDYYIGEIRAGRRP